MGGTLEEEINDDGEVDKELIRFLRKKLNKEKRN